MFKVKVITFLIVLLTIIVGMVWAGTVRLPRTGQTKCYDTAGNVISCANTGQDGDIQAGVAWPSPRFTDNGNGTITDNLTGLIWLKNANCFGAKTWQEALNSANTLNSGECGLSDGSVEGDWRLPNRNEMRSLIDYSRYSPAISLSYLFSNVMTLYWVSTTYANDTAYVWSINMWDGSISVDNRTNYYYVWPVRSDNRIMVTGDMDGNGKDEVIIDFGSAGIWVRYNNTRWVRLHNLSPEFMVTGDMDGNGKDEVIIDFGSGYGIWIRYNNMWWVKLHD